MFVFCCAHAAAVEAHLQGAGWLGRRGFAVHTIVSNCLSVGEALRLIYQVRGCWILLCNCERLIEYVFIG